MNKQHYLFLLLVSVVIISCQNRKDRSLDIRSVETTMQEIDQAEEKYKTIDVIKAGEYYDAIMGDINFIKGNKNIKLNKEQAMFLTKYKNVAKQVKKNKQKIKNIDLELVESRKQLNGLILLINSKATIDKNGIKIDDEYIDRAITSDLGYAKELISQIGFLEDNCNFILDAYSSFKEQANDVLADIQLKIKDKK